MYFVDGEHIGLFVCFKQKTAYEMRISDWSSDVCSSDLHQPRELLLLRHRWCREQLEIRFAQCAARAPEEVGATIAALSMARPGCKIGRAACRERVCQYV